MKRLTNYIKTVFAILLCTLNFGTLHAQKISAKDTAITVQDTVVSNIVNKVEKYNFTLKQTRSNISRDINITPVISNVKPLQKSITKMQDILDSSGKFMNLRRINTFAIMLEQYDNDLTEYKNTLTDYYNKLRAGNDTVVKIIKDSTLNIFIQDSTLEKQIQDVKHRAAMLDTAQKNKFASVTVLRNKVSLSLLQVRDMMSTINYRSKRLSKKMWSAEDLPLFKDRAGKRDQSIISLFGESMSRTFLITGIYISKQWDLLTIAIVLFLGIIIWTSSNMHRLKKLPERNDVLKQMFFLRPQTVILGGVLVFFIFLPFFFGDPPMSIVHFCELCRTVIVSILIYPYFTKSSKKLWSLFCVVWLFFIADDLLMDTSFSERWVLMLMSICYVILCIKILRKRESFFKKIPSSSVTKPLVIFCLLQILFSIFFNLTGRITLTKILSVSAVECLMLGITLKIFSSLVLEAVYLQSEAYRQSRLSEYINFKQLEYKFKRALWIIACIIWLTGIIRSWGMYSDMLNAITFFFIKQRSLGSHHFNYGSIALFIGIIWLSVILSSIINFFFGQHNSTNPANRKSIASMMLLIRLAIWTVGFLIAVAAAGIPLTQLTVMLGALSVGIGFGLQNIANNLVSGIILAFERPIQVGDQIDIGGKSGVVKEIGVRSSKLDPGNGADIIIPNGDLLSQQLTNWTMKDWAKLAEFTIGCSYESDIVSVKQIIADTLEKQENVLKKPAPLITLQNFADMAMEVKVSFWVNNLSSAGSIRSNVMINVYKALQEHNVKMPYPIIRPELIKGINK